MSENLFERSSCDSSTSLGCRGDGQTIEKFYRHPAEPCLRDDNLDFCHAASSQTSWTDEKHSLFLNYIEDAFVASLYDQGYYTYLHNRLQANRGDLSSVNTKNLTEEVESGFRQEYHESVTRTEKSQSEYQAPESHPDVVKHSTNWRSKDNCCCNEPSKKPETSRDTKLGRTKKRKFEYGFNGGPQGPQYAVHSTDNITVTIKYGGRRQITENRQLSDPSTKNMSNGQEDQVVPSMDVGLRREDFRL